MDKKEFDNFKGELKDLIEKYPEPEFYYRNIRPEPQAHEGLFFRQAVDNKEFPNVKCLGRIGDADRYRKEG